MSIAQAIPRFNQIFYPITGSEVSCGGVSIWIRISPMAVYMEVFREDKYPSDNDNFFAIGLCKPFATKRP